MSNLDDEARWRAVLARDPAADGLFFHAVATTGVYCRPSCGARTPRRENVAFFRSAADATRAGYRACKRCKPDGPPLTERRAATVAALCREIERHDDVPNLDELAATAGLSPSHLHRLFKATTGVTPRAYAQSVRAKRVRDALARDRTVTEAVHEAGYPSSGRFYSHSTKLLGMVPKQFQRGGVDARIMFAVGQCSLGAVLVAATNEGVCAILLGDEPGPLLDDLQRRFPKAELVGCDRDFERVVARVVALVERPTKGLELPLDVRGTAFQQRVWQALADIAPGTTTTYTEIAKRLGAPKSVRAVASACAANSLAVAIPCHRVVRADGALAGYRWGIERKRSLLDRERGG